MIEVHPELAAGLSKSFEIFGGNESEFCQKYDKPDPAMTFRQDKPISLRPIGIFGVEAEEFREQNRKNVDLAQGSADVSTARFMDDSKDAFAHF